MGFYLCCFTVSYMLKYFFSLSWYRELELASKCLVCHHQLVPKMVAKFLESHDYANYK